MRVATVSSSYESVPLFAHKLLAGVPAVAAAAEIGQDIIVILYTSVIRTQS